VKSEPTPERRSHAVLAITILAVLFVVVPFLFWQQTWFGRTLTDAELDRYLDDSRNARHVQHALVQISERMTAGDKSVQRWYPRLVRASENPNVEVRKTAAWTLGQDNRSDVLHQGLRRMLRDPDALVRRNAALSLVRFRDDAGRGELIGILRPHPIRAPLAGSVKLLVRAGQDVGAGTPIASIADSGGAARPVTSPFHARVEAVLATDGPTIAGADLAALSARPDDVWEALRALYLIGRPEDLADVERYTSPMPDMPSRISRQAALTVQAIRTRPEPAPTR
jgi:hypothetical protein